MGNEGGVVEIHSRSFGVNPGGQIGPISFTHLLSCSLKPGANRASHERATDSRVDRSLRAALVLIVPGGRVEPRRGDDIIDADIAAGKANWFARNQSGRICRSLESIGGKQDMPQTPHWGHGG